MRHREYFVSNVCVAIGRAIDAKNKKFLIFQKVIKK